MGHADSYQGVPDPNNNANFGFGSEAGSGERMRTAPWSGWGGPPRVTEAAPDDGGQGRVTIAHGKWRRGAASDGRQRWVTLAAVIDAGSGE